MFTCLALLLMVTVKWVPPNRQRSFSPTRVNYANTSILNNQLIVYARIKQSIKDYSIQSSKLIKKFLTTVYNRNCVVAEDIVFSQIIKV